MTDVTATVGSLPGTNHPPRGKTNAATQWLPPVGLILLSLVPVLAGAMRLNELMGSPAITVDNARFVASPIPVTAHIVSVTLFSLLGALQFVPSLRRGRPGWHRIAGRILIPAGVLVALSGLWMTVFYPRPVGDGESLEVVRFIVGSAMLASIALAVVALRRRDFTSHGAWMTRGYAIALGAGTQVLTMLPWVVIFGPIGAADELPRTLLMTAGWVINLALAEYIIRRRPGHRSNRTPARIERSLPIGTRLESNTMKHTSILGSSARRLAAQLLPAVALSVLLVSPVAAQPLAQAGGLEASAPDNLRCPGIPGPKDGFHFESQWQNVATYAGRVEQIALDHSCNLYVVDQAANQVIKYNADGKQIGTVDMLARDAGTDPVAGVAVAQDGTMYVADPGLHQVRKLSPSGQELGVWKSCDCPGQDGWMVMPVSIAIDGTSNNVYVLDRSADTVSRYSPDGKVQKVFGTQGEGPGQFDVPAAISLDRQGNVYVADWGNHRIQKFSPDGAVLGMFGTDGNGPGQIHLPSGIAVDRDGNMYVSDSDNWRMIKFAPDGTPVDQIPACPAPGDCGVLDGANPGQFFDHNGVVVDGQGNLYVADSGNNRVERRVVIEVANAPAAGVTDGGGE